jgi:exopolysaccharide production protein ExoQ
MTFVRDIRTGQYHRLRGEAVPLHEHAAKARAGPLGVISLDGVMAFLLLSLTLFILQLGTIGAGLFSLLTVGYAAARRDQLWAILRTRGFLLAIPGVAILSTYWSEMNALTLKLSLEFALTAVAGLLLSAAARPKPVLVGLFFAFLLYCALSFALGGRVALGASGATAFAGLNGGKNLLGDIAATGALVSIALAFIALAPNRRSLSLSALAAGGAGLQLAVLLFTRSAGAVFGVALALVAFAGLAAFRPANLPFRATLTGLLVASLAAASLFSRQIAAYLIEVGSTYFDKDPTLTGRTYLWQRALELIAEKPLVGRGYEAFWVQGNPDAEGLWRYAGIADRTGFNFHNTPLEILVHLGWLGLTVLAICAAVALVAMVVRFVTKPSLTWCFWLALLVYEFARMPLESIGLVPFYFSTVLIFAGMGFAFGSTVQDSHRLAWERRPVIGPDLSSR